MKSITIFAKQNGTLACLHVPTDARWAALDPKDTEKMKNFHPDEVYEICIGSDGTVNYLRQGCKIDFAYVMR